MARYIRGFIQSFVVGTVSKVRDHFRKAYSTTSKKGILITLCMITIIIISMLIRLQPLNWGYNLSEFDPYFHYQGAKYVAENGFSSWFDWHTPRSWSVRFLM